MRIDRYFHKNFILLLTAVMLASGSLSSCGSRSCDNNFVEFKVRQKDTRNSLEEELGIANMKRESGTFEPVAVLKESGKAESYLRERLILTTEPGTGIPLETFVPANAAGKLPMVLVIPGRDDDGTEIALQAVREGYVTLIPSARNHSGDCAAGRTGMGERVWDISRTIDWALENLPVDGTNIICTGLSDAGEVASYAGALDTRISISMPAAAFGRHLLNIAALIAPRIFHAINGRNDEFIPFEEATAALKDLRNIYETAGNLDGCSMYGGEGGHCFFEKGAWRFVSMRLFPPKDSVASRSSSCWDGKYEVTLDGEPAAIHSGPGFSYLVCHGDLPFTIAVKGIGGGDRLDVSPHKMKVAVCREENGAGFTIKEQGYYIAYGPEKHKLLIFAEPLPETPEGVDVMACTGIVADGKTNITEALQKAVNENVGKTLVFPAGVYLTSGLSIPSRSDIFLEEGAVIRADRDSVIYDTEGTHAFIEIKNARKVSLRGAGMIDGDGKTVKVGARNRRNVLAVESSDILLEGIFSMNPASWNTHILGCENVTLRNYKILNDFYIWNTDGVDPDCSDNVLIENCFAHCGDDCVAIKTTDRLGRILNLRGVTVRGCVFSSNKAGLKVGTETCGKSMSDILFENNVVIESWKPMYLHVSDGAELSNVVYRNNIYERCYTGPSAYDYYDGADITPGPPAYHFTVQKRHPESRLGSIHDVLVEGCVYETPFPSKAQVDNEYGTRLEVEFKNNRL